MTIGNFKKELRKMIRVLLWHPYLMLATLTLTLCAAVFEALGVGMLIPIVQSVEQQNIDSVFIKYAKMFFEFLGFDYSFVNLMLGFLFVVLLKYSLMGFQKYITKKYSATIKMDLRNKAFEKLLKGPLNFYYSNDVGELHATVFNSADFAGGSSELVLLSISSATLMVTYFTLNCLISFRLTLLASFLFIVILFIILPRIKKGNVYGNREKKLKADLSLCILDNLGGIKTLKAFHKEQMVVGKFRKIVGKYRQNAIEMELNSILSIFLYEPLIMITVVVVMIVAVQFYHLNIILLVTFFYIFNLLAPQVRAMNNYLMQIMHYLPHFSRTYGLIYKERENSVVEGELAVNGFQSTLEIKGLFFNYNKPQGDVLKNINLTIKKNTTVAFVGMSGGGKTTLIDILVRHHNIKQGAVFVDGIDLMKIRADSWSNIIGVVEQNPYIFNDTIYENIRFGLKNVTEDEVIMASKAANAHGFISRMQNSYQTVIGNQGIDLSGGQKQRIALARALLKNSEILIFDEATSQLDSESEQMIKESIDELGKEKTIIIIAHRFSTIVHSDTIFLLENGQIIEQGRHKELYRKSIRYKQYFDLQLAAPE